MQLFTQTAVPQTLLLICHCFAYKGKRLNFLPSCKCDYIANFCVFWGYWNLVTFSGKKKKHIHVVCCTLKNLVFSVF